MRYVEGIQARTEIMKRKVHFLSGCNALQQNSSDSVPWGSEHKTSSPGYLQNKWKAGMTVKSQEQNCTDKRRCLLGNAVLLQQPSQGLNTSKTLMSRKIKTLR